MFRPPPHCPVDGCTQPHLPRLYEAAQRPVNRLRLRFDTVQAGQFMEAFTAALSGTAESREREIESILTEHAWSHTAQDYLQTIRRLQNELAGCQTRTQPHQRPRDGAEMEQRVYLGHAAGANLPALLGIPPRDPEPADPAERVQLVDEHDTAEPRDEPRA